MRNIERLLTGLCFGVSLMAGIAHSPTWLLLPPLCFTAALIAQCHAVNRRIGQGAWPSIGYARFLFGTNLYLAIRNSLLSIGVFLAANQGVALLAH